MEWREVIQEQGLRTEDEYVRAVRKSRGVPLARAERRRLWPVFDAYRTNLEHAGLMELPDILRRARTELDAAGGAPRYRSIVVDEAQDFSADGLRLLRAIAGPERPDDLFLVGDAHQRIYGRPVALSQCGIQVRGRRSQTLRLNYRTTGAICRWSMGILKGEEIDDLDDGKADARGYVSLREGPAPAVHPCASPSKEEDAVVETIQAYIEAGTVAESICVVARTRSPLRDRIGPALERAGIATVLLEQEEPRLPGVRLATMYRVKGLEFAVVLLVGIGKHDVPLPTPDLQSDDPVMRTQTLLRERSLLYVAASRARDALHVFHSGEPSPFLATLGGRAVRKGSPTGKLETRPPSMPPPDVRPSVPSTGSGLGPRPMAVSEAILARPLSELDLPTRMENWAAAAGYTTFADLIRHSPSELMAVRNLGRKSVRDTRAIVERVTGRRWEELVENEGQATTEGGALLPTTPWDVMRTALTDRQRAIRLDDMDLSTRLKTFVAREKLETLGDLASVTRAVLMATPNLGRTTVADLPGLVAKHLQAVANPPSYTEESLLECFKAVVQPLDSMLRIIATRRSGLGGEPVTLKELGEMFGVSRERIRQLEARVCEQLGRQSWTTDARRRVELALVHGAVRTETLGQDPWWAAACESPSVVDFLVEHVLGTDAQVIELFGTTWLSRSKANVIEEAFVSLVSESETIPCPTAFATFDPRIAQKAEGFGPEVAAHFKEELKARMQVEGEPGQERVLAFGDTRNSEALAILRSASAPMHVDEVERRMGRRLGAMPEEILYFRRGYIGLRQHFPDFEGWKERLVPAAVRLVEELGPERQWYCGEILDELREQQDLPDWLTAFCLAALIKASGALRYLGRLRVVLPGGEEPDTRVYVHDALEELLRAAGEPMLRTELQAKLSQRIGTSEYGNLVFQRPQFVRVDAERIGLLSRDVPGGPGAIAEAGDHVEALLARRDRGLSDVHVHHAIVGLSKAHATWTIPLAMSVLRSDGRFRLSQSGAVGLASWESTRVPTRLELVRSALEEAGGRVSVEAVLARIEAHYGARPPRGSLISFVMNVGAGMEGEWIVKKTDEASG